MHIELNKREPVYVQVVRYFKKQIASGALEAGAEIPSRRELANQLKINPNTVQRAYKEMESIGLIQTKGNLPSTVTEDELMIREIRESLLNDAIHSFMATVRSLRMSVDDVIPLLEAREKEEESL
ncbi:MAG TPA: GntR family transcriptional regulator [Bacillota bacterium]|nr:GntR family transcriptional regulator [Bacillota bacterium]